MNTVEILEKARELISDESRWTKGEFAINAKGEFVDIMSPEACKFCADGALMRVATGEGGLRDKNYGRAFKKLCAVTPSGFGSIISFNDKATHVQVLEVFDRAIAAARDA
jgi:hypothetical protein